MTISKEQTEKAKKKKPSYGVDSTYPLFNVPTCTGGDFL